MRGVGGSGHPRAMARASRGLSLAPSEHALERLDPRRLARPESPDEKRKLAASTRRTRHRPFSAELNRHVRGAGVEELEPQGALTDLLDLARP